MDETKRQLRVNVWLRILKTNVTHDLDDLKEIVELTEQHLATERKRLEKRVARDLSHFADEKRAFASDWFADDFVRLDRVFPNLQRRALFTTVMSMTEANLLLACKASQRAFELPKLSKKKGNQRQISHALSYLTRNLTFSANALEPHWDKLQNLWTLRNALVHNDGVPRPNDLEKVDAFCSQNPHVELDQSSRIILHKGSVESALDVVDCAFSQLFVHIDEYRQRYKSVVATRGSVHGV